jgi:hypothetical protein
MRFLLQGRDSLPFISPTMIVAGRLVKTGAVLTCMLWLGVEVHCAIANARPGQLREKFSPGTELAWWYGAAEGQVPGSIGNLKINVEAYNKKREKEIADDSRKLLSLAIALKSDLEQNSDSGPAAVSKAKQIEKLAHDVKENMKLNILGPH